ncbi:MAG TPA: sulfate adenylyltransferase subunit CysN [Casimicrobiaceae bacterium]|nr:sulfate adenylyltransferase subunit CysN [Casimicrobiaceae bacterium]
MQVLLMASVDTQTRNGNLTRPAPGAGARDGAIAPRHEDASATTPDTDEVFRRLTERPVELLRFATAGSVDDGKSTLIGRLLYDSKQVFTDQLEHIEQTSERMGHDFLDLSLLTDGLRAEREQGITIDVAYRYFSTPTRRYVVADTPGHEHYTRNMVTGASTADLAIVLVDAQQGLTGQTRRHAYIVALLGVHHVVLAVNKMDLVGYAEAAFTGIETAFREFAGSIGIGDVACIPLSAVHGDNVAVASAATPWYRGPTLMHCLETAEVGDDLAAGPLRMPVQWVNRPHPAFRGYAGTIVSGSVRPGDAVEVQPSGLTARVARIVTADGDLPLAIANQAVTLTLDREIDVGRGDVIAAAAQPVASADQFEATIVWMDKAPLLRGRSYVLKLGARTVNATVAPIKYRVNVHTLEHVAAGKLDLNDIGVCDIELDRPLAYEAYADNRDLGGFILIDRMTNNTVGAGMLSFALRRASNLHWQAFDVDRRVRGSQKMQKPCVLWFTGLSGAGKSTIANLVDRKLNAEGRHTYVLDGDNVRKGLNRDLGFTAADRVENIRRVAEVAALMADAGLIVLTAFISPFRDERGMARARVPDGEFIEVFVDTPLAVAEARDVKGLYRKARRGELANFTGIDSPYEPPLEPEIRIDSAVTDAEAAAERIVDELRRRGFLVA